MKLYKSPFFFRKMPKSLFRLKTYLYEFARKLFSLVDYVLWILFDITKLKKIKNEKIKKILIVLINQEKGNIGGDFVTLGVLNCFKKQYPKIELSILSDKKTIKQFGKLNNIDLIEYKSKNTLNEIKNKNFDAVLFFNRGKLKVNVSIF